MSVKPAVFLDRVLDPPSYGFSLNGELVVPTTRELFREFVAKTNIFESRKHWLAFFGWTLSLSFAIPLYFFITRYFSWPLVLVGFVYSMVGMGSHGTFWLHRYCAHRAYRFTSPFVRFICRNLVIKVIPEETYAVSHYVHHLHSEKPGDPYNVHGGWLYCFLADANHQGVSKDLTPEEYKKLSGLMDHTGVRLNTYVQYQRWGTMAHPLRTVLHYAGNWAFWFGTFYLIGGPALATAIFGAAGFWAFGVRTFNFDGHGRGADKRQEGSDFNRTDLSVNQIWPGYVAGEWHNNHHLYPNGIRSGFLPHQLDLPYLLIKFLRSVGAVTSCRDYKEAFFRDHYEPYLASIGEQTEPTA